MDDVNLGAVISVRGSVVDAYFPNTLPSLQNELHAGDRNEIVVEVSAHLDAQTVRGIALTPTQGLARGAPIVDLGHPLRAPVGRSMLGRVFNVFGDVIDGDGSAPADI